MGSTLLLVLGLCFVLFSGERSSVYGDRRFLVTTGFMITNQRILPWIPYEQGTPTFTNECGGLITRAPGTIELTYNKRRMRSLEDKHCIWTLRAPPAHRAYLRDLEIIRTSAGSSGFGSSDTFNDAPRIEVYDGPKVDEAKKIFRFGNDTMNNCDSSGQELTIELRHEPSEKYIEEKIIVNYGFADEKALFAHEKRS